MSSQSIDSLIAQCQSGDARTQISTMLDLEEARAVRALPVILPLLTSEDEDVRATAARVLGRLGDPDPDRVGAALEAQLTDPDGSVRNQVAEALGILRYAPARAALERALGHDDEWVVRCSAAEALAELGDIHAMDALEAALADEVEPVRGYAVRAIGLLGNESHGPIIARRLAVETEPGLRGDLLAAAARLGDDSALDELMLLADDATGDLMVELHGTVVDLIESPHHSMIATRVAELSRTARNPRLKERLAELVKAGDVSE